MRGLREDHQACEKTDDGEHPGSSDGRAVPVRPQIYTSQESATEEDCQPNVHVNASYKDEGGKNPKFKDEKLSAGACDSDCVQVNDSIQVDDITLTQQAEDETRTATEKDVTMSDMLLEDGDRDSEKQREMSKDKKAESIVVPVPLTPDPFDPRSPAPLGQHHMRTQVSLEVVQCRSAATSPMTPPEGGNSSFFFPSSFGRSAGVGTDTKDAELQVGQQAEFCSVATSPMTPKTPSTTAFPVLTGRESARKEDKVKQIGEHRDSGQQESCPASKGSAEAESEISRDLKFKASQELTEGLTFSASPEGSASCPRAGLKDSQVVEDNNQQCKQQRMGSMDQDITILVTHYSNNNEDGEEKAESSFYSIEPEMVKIDEYEELSENKSNLKEDDGKESMTTESVPQDQIQSTLDTNPPKIKTEESPAKIKSDNSEVKESKDACEELKEVTKPPESPAPFGCHNIRTQVSLEVVQCQSAATSPMTPPEGEQAFYFPSSYGRCVTEGAETKDAEMQVGQQVEFRSVATAPMTPRTPVATTFPEIRKAASIEEKIVEEEDKTEQGKEDKKEVIKEEQKVTEEEKEEAAEDDTKEAIDCKEKGEEKGEDKGEEPVQEVSWDEKGMTWEVYGAVVEVAVLGSAIQKHLEKQVKKQKLQPSMPPPPPLTPSATPLTPEAAQGCSGSGKGQAGKRGERDGKVRRHRRNPFRQLMENMQQPHCCSRAHTTE